MKNIKLLLVNLLLAGFTLFQLGCVSSAAYKMNERAAYGEVAAAQNTPQAIKAYASRDYVGLGVDLTKTDVIFRSWGSFGVQAVGALADAGLAYGAYELIDGLNSSDSSSRSTDITSGGDTTNIEINGDDNDVTVTNTENNNEPANEE